MQKILLLLLIILSGLCYSSLSFGTGNSVLTVDRSVSKNLHLSFPNNNNITPKDSDFKIINYVLMSNQAGERWSVITMTNTSSGTRSLEHSHLMALFADGSRANPQAYKLNFSGNQTQSITVSFGENKFPILSLYTNNDS